MMGTAQGRLCPPYEPGLQPRAPSPCALPNPVAVQRQRRGAGDAAAAGGTVRPRRPADDADDGGAAWLLLEHGPAGIAGAGAHSIAKALADRIDQADLQRS